MMLEVKDLSVAFHTEKGEFQAVDSISFTIDKGEILALVGESGAGKSVTAFSILQLLPYPQAFHPSGSILFHGREVLGARDADLRQIRGNKVTMIFQEPMTSLNPLHTVLKQVRESIIIHQGLSDRQATEKAFELFRIVQLPDIEKRPKAYPHELSGGQRQRVMIAMALANQPDLLIADEPTTALDVTIQAEILNLLKELRRKLGMGLLIITHDLTIVRKIADNCCIMKEGKIVERGPVARVFKSPEHEYTKMLLDSEPKGAPHATPSMDKPVLLADNLSVTFPIGKNLMGRPKSLLKAVDSVNIKIHEAETIGVVGESGSGKTTLALAALRLIRSRGSIVFLGGEIQGLKSRQVRPLRKKMQIVFQDPFGSLNPRFTIAQIIEEGLLAHKMVKDKVARRKLIAEVLEEVGIEPENMDRYPYEFSGGQRQRISIARALILKPELIILDEPTSSLDLSVQAQVLELLKKIQEKHRIAYLFISHDLKVVRSMSHSIVIMEKGKIVEYGPAEKVFTSPAHPYTQKLLEAALAFSEA
ncbi:MAG: ABC transporter ATP-binding protein [Spirochaetales bacterium]|nr:ABC transporter ATP-binding protein [Spirochaetales bacterium]